jgi:hypothetical protein
LWWKLFASEKFTNTWNGIVLFLNQFSVRNPAMHREGTSYFLSAAEQAMEVTQPNSSMLMACDDFQETVYHTNADLNFG